jgi:hypothetical protein
MDRMMMPFLAADQSTMPVLVTINQNRLVLNLAVEPQEEILSQHQQCSTPKGRAKKQNLLVLAAEQEGGTL